MKIKVLLFGIIKDLINETSLEIELPKSSSLSDLKILLFKDYINLKSHKNFAIAVNEVYKEDSYLLKSEDIVALIPPVSGG
jgi:molybdopterin converting factor small subunit